MSKAWFSRRGFCLATAGLAGCAAAPRESAQSAGAIRLAGGVSYAATRFDLLDNRIFVETWINDQGPFSLIFDTGGANILAPGVVDQLGLQRRNPFSMAGVGSGQEDAWRVDVSSARIGPTLSQEVEFSTFSLTAIQRAIGLPRLDGLFGHELLRRFVVAVDYDRSELVFAEPSAAPPAIMRGEGLPITFVGNLPRVAATIDGEAISAVIDTGDRSSLTLLTPFVERNGLRERYTPNIRAVTGFGVGGPIVANVVRVPRLGLGDFVVERVVTRMAAPGMGAFSGDAADASIGTGVMKRFGVTFDYGRNRLILRRGAGYAQADPLDRSGMWLAMAGDGSSNFQVTSIVDGGPAARAGLREGDVIVAIDGASSAGLSLLTVRAQLCAPSDPSQVRLRRADNSEVLLRLEDVLETNSR